MPPLLIGALVVIAGCVLIANVLASGRIIRDDLATHGQKAAQFLFVWLVPIVGAIFVFVLTRGNLEPHSGRYPKGREGPDDDLDVAKVDYSSPD